MSRILTLTVMAAIAALGLAACGRKPAASDPVGPAAVSDDAAPNAPSADGSPPPAPIDSPSVAPAESATVPAAPAGDQPPEKP